MSDEEPKREPARRSYPPYDVYDPDPEWAEKIRKTEAEDQARFAARGREREFTTEAPPDYGGNLTMLGKGAGRYQAGWIAAFLGAWTNLWIALALAAFTAVAAGIVGLVIAVTQHLCSVPAGSPSPRCFLRRAPDSSAPLRRSTDTRCSRGRSSLRSRSASS